MITWLLVFVFSCTNLIPVAAFAANEQFKVNSQGRNAPSPLAPLPPAGEGNDQSPAGKVRTGDIHMEGAKLQAKDISLDAANNLKLTAAANTSDTQSKNKSSSTGAGATLALGGQQNGLSFQLSASMAKGRANGSQTTYDNTLISATDHLTIKSGKDTTLSGAQLAGNKVNAIIGGDFNIITLQDLSNYESKQESAGFNLSVCIPPICYGTAVTGGVNYSKNTLSHNYQSAVGQSGITAGTDGFDIKVKGNTALTGAAITSAAEQSKNSFSTASLSYSDLANKDVTKATSISVSVSTGNLASNFTANAMGNLAGQAGMPKSGSSTGETNSVISPANITLTGTGDTAKDQASQSAASTLTSRDASTANGSLKNTLTLQQVGELQQKQKEQAENQAAANAMGAVATNMIGDLAQKNHWADGSPEKIVLHGLAGVIQAKLGGTSALAGFAAGAGKEAVTPLMENYLISQGYKYGSSEFNEMMKLGSTLVGAATGAVAGGSIQSAHAGANVALIAEQNNRALHESEKKRIKELAKNDPKLEGRLLIASCALTKCSAEFALGSPEYVQAKAFEDAGNSDAFKNERNLLSQQTGARGIHLFGYDSSYLGGDAGIDAAKRWNNTTGVITRISGAAQVIGGLATGTVSSGLVVAGGASCAETLGVGCLVAAGGYAGALWSSDQVAAGGTSFVTGRPTPTLGGQLAANLFGVSAQTGELLNGLVGLSPLAIDAALTSSAGKALTAVNSTKSATGDAKVTNNYYRDGNPLPEPLSTSSGIVIQGNSAKTTTVLGTYIDDTKNIIGNQLDYPKSLNFLDPKTGGYNLLNTPDELYAALGPDKFWKQVNEPFLAAAVKRGDDIYLATKPTSTNLQNLNNSDGLSGFGREYKYLTDRGFVYDAATGRMCIGVCKK